MPADPTDIAPSALADLPATLGCGGGVIASEREGRGIVRVASRRGQAAEVAERIRASFGIEPPNAPRRVNFGDVALAGIGPQIWLAVREGAGNAFAQSLRSLLEDCASVADQSDAHVILRLVGPKVRETLAKLVPVDVHARSFQVGDVAQTTCGYISVTLWRLEDTAQNGPTFEIWAARSFAASLHQAIAHSAAEFGFVRELSRHPAALRLEA